MTANNTADTNKYKCSNAFKEKGKTYRYDDTIEEAEYQSISENNKKWFYPVAVPLAPQSEQEQDKAISIDELVKHECIYFALYLELLPVIKRFSVHPPAGSGGSTGIYEKTIEQLYNEYKSKPTPAAYTVNKTEGGNDEAELKRNKRYADAINDLNKNATSKSVEEKIIDLGGFEITLPNKNKNTERENKS